MSPGDLAHRLGRLESGLESLLSAIESPQEASPAGIKATFSEVADAFDTVRASIEAQQPQGEEQGRVEKCLRLYAVTVNSLVRQREQLALEQKACGEVRGKLSELRHSQANGGSCDVRG